MHSFCIELVSATKKEKSICTLSKIQGKACLTTFFGILTGWFYVSVSLR